MPQAHSQLCLRLVESTTSKDPAIPGREGTGGRATERKGRGTLRAGDRAHFRGERTRERTESDPPQRLGPGCRQATAQARERLCARAEEPRE
jgi:hypothetical protein